MIRWRLARASGCDLARTCTRPGTTSQRNAERLGFRVAYTKPQLMRTLDRINPPLFGLREHNLEVSITTAPSSCYCTEEHLCRNHERACAARKETIMNPNPSPLFDQLEQRVCLSAALENGVLTIRG
jgi:hypothetical protein